MKNNLNTKSDQNINLLENLSIESKSVLFHFHTSFPFDLFPDEIVIDENKVNIITKDFLFVHHLRSILIEDITDVSVDTGLLFAAITIIDSGNYRFPITITIKFLLKKDALRARDIIQGLILAKNNNINLSSMTVSKVRKEITALGKI